MGIFDRLKQVDKATLEQFAGQARDKVADAVEKHGDTITGGIDKAAGLADKKTGGKYTDKIAGGAAKAKEGLEKIERRPGAGGDPS